MSERKKKSRDSKKTSDEGKPRESAKLTEQSKTPSTDSYLNSIKLESPLIVLLILAYHVIMSLYIRSYYNPDEYWQSVEIAHKMVFGYGYETWEWTIDTPIRSVLFPMFYACFYWILSIFGLDSGFLVAYGPRMLQGCIATLVAYYIYWIAKDISKSESNARICLLAYFGSWYMNFTMIRTLSNTMEGSLVVITYYHWTKLTPKFSKNDILVGALYAFMFIMRATSGIVSFSLVVMLIFRFKLSAIKSLILQFVTGALPVLAFEVLVDYRYFGTLQNPMINFYLVNERKKISSYYGVLPNTWYILDAIPDCLNAYLPFAAIGLAMLIFVYRRYSYIVVVVVYIFSMSILPHKEQRFLLGVMPLVILACGFPFAFIKDKFHKLGYAALFIAILMNTHNLLIANSKGGMAAFTDMDELRAMKPEEIKGVYFLMNCHVTPFYSFIHRNITMGFPSCPPPLNPNEITENSKAQVNMRAYLNDLIRQKKYSHIIIESEDESRLIDIFKENGYKRIKKIFDRETPSRGPEPPQIVWHCIYSKEL